MKGGWVWVLVVVIVVEFAAIAYLVYENRETKAAYIKIKENADKVVSMDSVVSASERKLMMHMDTLKREIQTFKDDQHRENTNLRNLNYRLEKRFRDLDVSDRPEF